MGGLSSSVKSTNDCGGTLNDSIELSSVSDGGFRKRLALIVSLMEAHLDGNKMKVSWYMA